MSINGATYGGSVLGRLGIDLVTAESEVAYPVVELDEIALARPRAGAERALRLHRGASRRTATAFPGREIVRVDGQDLFWWGIRTPGAIRRLAAVLGSVPGAVGGDDVPALGE